MGNRRILAKVLFFALGSVPLIACLGRAFAAPRATPPNWNGLERTTVITCPVCNDATSETMAQESIKRVYHCPRCLTWLAPKRGDHCIYDSYGSVKCPSRQLSALMKLRGAVLD